MRVDNIDKIKSAMLLGGIVALIAALPPVFLHVMDPSVKWGYLSNPLLFPAMVVSALYPRNYEILTDVGLSAASWFFAGFILKLIFPKNNKAMLVLCLLYAIIFICALLLWFVANST
jgi:hypothetical protein